MSLLDFLAQPSTSDIRGALRSIPVRKGGILPLTEYGDGSARLDWTAGVPGSIMDAFTAPARAYRGEIAPENMIPEGLNFAGSVALGSAAVPRPRGSVGMGSLKEGASHLDMSPEARMARAREMGFNTSDTYYHGTHSDFDQFDTSGIGVLGRGTYFTRNAPGTASVWARGEDGSVIPAYIRGNYPDISEAGALYRYMPGFIQKRMAESRGHDGYTTGGGAIVAVHDPSNIRSVNAAFDPAKSSSANLLVANPETSAAPGLGLMAAAKQDHQSEPPLMTIMRARGLLQ